MLKSDIGKDGRRLAGFVRMSLSDVARKMGVRPQMVQKYLKGGISQGYIDFVEACGYDIELKYVRRPDFQRWPVGYSKMLRYKQTSDSLKAFYLEERNSDEEFMDVPEEDFEGYEGK